MSKIITQAFDNIDPVAEKRIIELINYIEDNYPRILDTNTKEGRDNIDEFDKILNGKK